MSQLGSDLLAGRPWSQVAAYSGPWYAYPGTVGVAVTDLIGAALVDIVSGASRDETVAFRAGRFDVQNSTAA